MKFGGAMSLLRKQPLETGLASLVSKLCHFSARQTSTAIHVSFNPGYFLARAALLSPYDLRSPWNHCSL